MVARAATLPREEQMLHIPLCTLLGIEFPIIQAGMGAFTAAELAAAVSNAGVLGSVGTFLRPVEDLPQQLALYGQGPGGPVP
jgi:nitronate monooxygenase/enoyl-[acyl-carrier protein] reductase II